MQTDALISSFRTNSRRTMRNLHLDKQKIKKELSSHHDWGPK